MSLIPSKKKEKRKKLMNRPPTHASGEASQRLPPAWPNFLINSLVVATIGCIHPATGSFTDVFVILHCRNEKNAY